MDILKIATINSARCVGVEKDYGSIEVGKQADLVCLEENPLENISNVRKINRVIQSGKIVVEKIKDGIISNSRLFSISIHLS